MHEFNKDKSSLTDTKAHFSQEEIAVDLVIPQYKDLLLAQKLYSIVSLLLFLLLSTNLLLYVLTFNS